MKNCTGKEIDFYISLGDGPYLSIKLFLHCQALLKIIVSLKVSHKCRRSNLIIPLHHIKSAQKYINVLTKRYSKIVRSKRRIMFYTSELAKATDAGCLTNIL